MYSALVLRDLFRYTVYDLIEWAFLSTSFIMFLILIFLRRPSSSSLIMHISFSFLTLEHCHGPGASSNGVNSKQSNA